MENFQDRANFIWQVADDIIRGAFRRHDSLFCGRDCVLEAVSGPV